MLTKLLRVSNFSQQQQSTSKHSLPSMHPPCWMHASLSPLFPFDGWIPPPPISEIHKNEFGVCSLGLKAIRRTSEADLRNVVLSRKSSLFLLGECQTPAALQPLKVQNTLTTPFRLLLVIENTRAGHVYIELRQLAERKGKS